MRGKTGAAGRRVADSVSPFTFLENSAGEIANEVGRGRKTRRPQQVHSKRFSAVGSGFTPFNLSCDLTSREWGDRMRRKNRPNFPKKELGVRDGLGAPGR